MIQSIVANLLVKTLKVSTKIFNEWSKTSLLQLKTTTFNKEPYQTFGDVD